MSSGLSRRSFVKLGGMAGAGLAIGVTLPSCRPWQAAAMSDGFQPNAFLHIDMEGLVSIWVHQSEMGQGVWTALPMLAAEELDADWDKVSVVQADAHPEKYGVQMTGGSSAVRTSWDRLRKMGAAARTMLVNAAAEEWGVDAAECTTANSVVTHTASGRSADYGSLATAASRQPIPEDPPLKAQTDFRLMRTSVGRKDTPMKIDGSAIFGIDVRVPGMLQGTVIRPPNYGATLASFDAAEALAMPGVRDVFAVTGGVAVVAQDTWSAFKAAKAVTVEWDRGDFRMSSDDITDHFRAVCERPGTEARNEGSAQQVVDSASDAITAIYEVPYLAHATMEPMNCTASVTSDACEIWAPTQDPQTVQQVASQMTGLPIESVSVKVTFLGGGFGRRAERDFIIDALEASQHVGAPVQITWTREDDTRHDFFRPATYNRFAAVLGSDGMPTAWTHRIVSPSIWQRFFGSPPPGGFDPTSVEGAANLPYHIPNIFVDCCESESQVPVGWWRSVGSSQNAFVTEGFIDELAHQAGRDPFEYRRDLLQEHPRHLKVLEEAAERSGWGSPLPSGRARGIAMAESFGSFVAQVAEVSMDDGSLRVHKVTCAIDCGQYVNPNTIEAQVESAIVYGLTAALRGEITIAEGSAVQSNFDDYQVMRISEMPEVDVHIVDSGEAPGGVGEPGTPPIAPAVANAVFALTGRRIRKLPIEPQLAS